MHCLHVKLISYAGCWALRAAMASLSDCTSSAGMESRSVRGLGGRVELSSVLWKRMLRRRGEDVCCGVWRGLRRRVVEGAGQARFWRRRVCWVARVRERRAVEGFIVCSEVKGILG